jgi:hypothetical protein
MATAMKEKINSINILTIFDELSDKLSPEYVPVGPLIAFLTVIKRITTFRLPLHFFAFLQRTYIKMETTNTSL